MRVSVYMRLAKDRNARTGWRVDASMQPKHDALQGTSGESLHTLRFVEQLEVPDALLKPAGWPIIEVQLTPDGATQVPIEVTIPADVT